MPLYTLEDFYPNYQDELFGGDEIKGVPVYTETAEKVGTISGALVDQEGRFRYLIMDTGFWIFGKQVLLPIEQAQSSPAEQRLYLKGLSKSEAAMLPQYDENAVAELGVAPVELSESETEPATDNLPDVSSSDPQLATMTAIAPNPTDSPSSSLTDSALVPDSNPTSTSAESRPTTTRLAPPEPADWAGSTPRRPNRAAVNTMLVPDPSDYGTTTDELPTWAEPSPPASEAISPAAKAESQSSAAGSPELVRQSDTALEQPQTAFSESESHIVPVYEEQLATGKQRQRSGAITVSKRVEIETAHVAVPLEKERVIIEHHPASSVGQVVSVTPNDFQSQEIARIELFEEIVEIQRQPVVREEVRIRKEVSRETLSTEESLRREELDVQTEGNPAIDWRKGDWQQR